MKKKWSQMTTQELREATKEFDKPMAFKKAKALTQQDKVALAPAKKPGRPKVGLGAEKIRVSIERSLLARVDQKARQLHLSRSELIARGLEVMISG